MLPRNVFDAVTRSSDVSVVEDADADADTDGEEEDGTSGFTDGTSLSGVIARDGWTLTVTVDCCFFFVGAFTCDWDFRLLLLLKNDVIFFCAICHE